MKPRKRAENNIIPPSADVVEMTERAKAKRVRTIKTRLLGVGLVTAGLSLLGGSRAISDLMLREAAVPDLDLADRRQAASMLLSRGRILASMLKENGIELDCPALGTELEDSIMESLEADTREAWRQNIDHVVELLPSQREAVATTTQLCEIDGLSSADASEATELMQRMQSASQSFGSTVSEPNGLREYVLFQGNVELGMQEQMSDITLGRAAVELGGFAVGMPFVIAGTLVVMSSKRQ